MKWIVDNWSFLVVLAGICIIAYTYVKKFTTLPTNEQIDKIKEWLLFAVIQAEKEFGDGTGVLKLRYVYDLFVTTFPDIAKVISFETFSKLVDEVLEQMHKIIDTNLDIAYYIERPLEEN